MDNVDVIVAGWKEEVMIDRIYFDFRTQIKSVECL